MKIGQVKVTGNGLIGKSMKIMKSNENISIIAAGVSDSKESRSFEFKREEKLIKQILKTDKKHRIIYFSSCSITSNLESEYINHKINMEETIRKNCNNFIIIRLPQVVGYVINSTLVSFLIKNLLAENEILIELNSRRYLIDIEDIVRLTKKLIDSNLYIGETINISPKFDVSVLNLVSYLIKKLKIKSNYKLEKIGYSQEIDISKISSLIKSSDIILKRNYWKKIIDKYIPIYLKAEFN